VYRGEGLAVAVAVAVAHSALAVLLALGAISIAPAQVTTGRLFTRLNSQRECVIDTSKIAHIGSTDVALDERKGGEEGNSQQQHLELHLLTRAPTTVSKGMFFMKVKEGQQTLINVVEEEFVGKQQSSLG